MEFCAPPGRVHVRMLPQHDRAVTLLARGLDVEAMHVADWLATHKFGSVESSPRFARSVVDFHVPEPPGTWRAFVSPRKTELLTLTADGRVSGVIVTTPADVDTVTRELHKMGASVQPQGTHDVAPLTAHQHRALAFAHARGYYDIPRRSGLREIASEIGVSAATLSEVLRRGERHVITGFLDENPEPDSG